MGRDHHGAAGEDGVVLVALEQRHVLTELRAENDR
jgi:hypothetical protein